MTRGGDTRVSPRGQAVVGLDLSLRGTAAVLVPAAWEVGNWRELDSVRVGYEVEGRDPAKSAERIVDIVGAVRRFLRDGYVGRKRAPHVFVEDYAGGLASKSGLALAELGGAVKAMLYAEYDVVAVPVNQSRVRRYFLNGRPVPGGKGGMATALAAAWGLIGGRPFEDSDRNDALLVASYGRTELGMVGLLSGDLAPGTSDPWRT